jgi:hypothetical protein
MARQLVTLAQAAEQRPWATVRYTRRLISERRIPFHKLGDGRTSRVLVDLAELDAFAERGRVEPSSPVALAPKAPPVALPRGRPRREKAPGGPALSRMATHVPSGEGRRSNGNSG